MVTITRSQHAKTQKPHVESVGLLLHLRRQSLLVVVTQISQMVIPATHLMTMKNMTTCTIAHIVL